MLTSHIWHTSTDRRPTPDDNHISIFPVISLACNQRRPFTLRPCKNPDCCFLKSAARVCEPHRKVGLYDLCAREAFSWNYLKWQVKKQFSLICFWCICAHWCSFLLCVCSYLHLCVSEFASSASKAACPSGLYAGTSTNPSHLPHLASLPFKNRTWHKSWRLKAPKMLFPPGIWV